MKVLKRNIYYYAAVGKRLYLQQFLFEIRHVKKVTDAKNI